MTTINKKYLGPASLALLLLLAISPAYAAPPPKNKAGELGAYREKIETEKKQKAQLEKEAEKQNLEIAKIKDSLLESAAKIRGHEDEIRKHELEIQNLEARRQLIKTGLEQDRASLSKLILALERLRRVPPEAMIARPDAPYETAQSALLMGEIATRIQQEAQALKNKLGELEKIASEMKVRKKILADEAQSLQARHAEIEDLIRQREDLYRKTHKDIAAREAEIQRLSLQSKNIEDLVKRLEKERTRQEKRELEQEKKRLDEERKRALAQAPSTIKPVKPSQTPKFSGKITGGQLPISGIIRTRFQEKDDLGAKSNGLTIEGRSGAMVLAPIDGKIQFAGAFKRYGNLIIIEHAKGYHSLVAGMGKINAVVGQAVSAGEPLGLLPQTTGPARPKLYYELRQGGQPINPSVLFSELS